MNDEEFRKKIKEIEEKAKQDKNEVFKEFALSNNLIAIGDIAQDHIGKILVSKIMVSGSLFSNVPGCVYSGVELKKDNTPFKSGNTRLLFQSNLKSINGIEVSK